MSVHVVRSKRKRWNSYPALYNPTRGYGVLCDRCNWRGYRRGLDCECYEDWAPYCRPWSPGPGCPSGITYRCPRCAWPNDVVRIPSRDRVHGVYEYPPGVTTNSWWWFTR